MTQVVRRIILISLLVFLGAASVGGFLWNRGVIQTWLVTKIEAEAVRLYHEKIEGHIPFEIESAHVDHRWSDLLAGRMADVSLVLRKEDLRIELKGPLTFPAINWTTLKRLYRRLSGETLERFDREMRIDYFPVVRFESVKNPRSQSLPPPLSLHLWAGVSSELDELNDVGLEASQSSGGKWKWTAQGIEIEKPVLSARWSRGSQKDASADAPVRIDFKAALLSFSRKTEKGIENSVNVVEPRASAQFPLSIQPFRLGQIFEMQWRAQSGEALWGDRYFSATTSPLDGKARLVTDSSPTDWKSIELALGKNDGRQAHLVATRKSREAQIQFKLDPIELKDLVPAFVQATANAGAPFSSLSFLQAIQFKEGQISAQADASIALDPQTHLPQADASPEGTALKTFEARIENAGLVWPAKQLAIKRLNLSLPYRAHKGVEGEVSIGRFAFRKLHGSLRPTWISYQEREKENYLRIGQRGSTIPLDLDGLLLRIDSIAGTAKLSPLQYDLDTSVRLEPVALEKITGPLCLTQPQSRVVPATVRIDLPKVDLYTGAADLTGFFRADLFGGSIRIDQMGAYEIFSEVPEFDFNLDMNGIDLHEIGTWVNFGEMDGTLTGYAHNVVFQSALPTQYDLEAKVQPKNHSDVVFSPEAMKNFARLFAEEGIDRIPEFAQWFAFGLPSRLLGGYNIDYAGVHVHSEEGYIRLETLDPLQDSEIEGSHQKHFILYGRRFKIPIKSSRYPLILDAAAMGNFVHRKWAALESLSKKKKGETSAHDLANPLATDSGSFDDEIQKSASDTLPADCVPSDLPRL